MAQEPGALLMVMVEIEPDRARDLNDWYDEEHFPEKLAEPGYRDARLYVDEQDAGRFLALYDLDTPETAMPNPAHRKPASERSKQMIASWKAWSRGIWDELPSAEANRASSAVLLMTTEIDPDSADEFEAWCAGEFVPTLLSQPGVASARRFRSHDDPAKHLVLFELDDAAAGKAGEAVKSAPSQRADWERSVWTAV